MPTGIWLLDEPTRGDLAGDAAFVGGVRVAWRQYHEALELLSRMAGDTHIVWAGSTPAGPAAFVAQREEDAGSTGPQLYVGFVESSPGGLRVVDPVITFTPTAPDQVIPAALLGNALDVLVVIDFGVPVSCSTELSYASDGRVARTFRPMPFVDGAAVVRVPPQGDRISVALRADQQRVETHVDLVNVDRIKSRSGPEQPQVDHLEQRVLPGAGAVWPADPAKAQDEASPWRDEALAPYNDIGGFNKTSVMPQWWIRGATADGRRLWVETLTVWDDPARVVAVLGRAGARPRVVYGGTMAKDSPLQVQLRLPDRQGVVVAAKGATMRYRTRDGGWRKVSGDAALLPDTAAEVEVTAPNGRPTRVPVR